MKKLVILEVVALVFLALCLTSCESHVGKDRIAFFSSGLTGGRVPITFWKMPDDTITIPGPGTMVREGCAFKEWNTSPTGDGVSYKPGDTYQGDDLDLFAIWLGWKASTVNQNISGYGSDSAHNITIASNNGLVLAYTSGESWKTPRIKTQATATYSPWVNAEPEFENNNSGIYDFNLLKTPDNRIFLGHLLWTSQSTTDIKVYQLNSSNNVTEMALPPDTAEDGLRSMSLSFGNGNSGNYVFMAYESNSYGGRGRIMAIDLNNPLSTWSEWGDGGIFSDYPCTDVSCAYENLAPIVAFSEPQEGGRKIAKVKRSYYEDPDWLWNDLGSALPGSVADGTNPLQLCAANAPVVAYMDADSDNKLRILQFTSGSWGNYYTEDFISNVGVKKFAITTQAHDFYVAFIDNNDDLTVMKKTEENGWETLGQKAFLQGCAEIDICLLLDEAYIAVTHTSNTHSPYNVSIYKYQIM